MILGGVLGFMFFLFELEAPDMGGVIFRCGRFAPENILEFVKHPFTHKTLWNRPLWAVNWIITTTIGVLFALVSGQLVRVSIAFMTILKK